MAQPDRQQYIDNINQDVAMAYFQNASNFVSTQVFPAVTVSKQSEKYYQFSKNDFMREQLVARPNASESTGTGFSLSTDSYNCEVFARHRIITQRDRANWNLTSITIEQATTEQLMQVALQTMERDWASNFFSAGLWGTTTTLTGNDLWSAYGTSDPLANVDEAKSRILNRTGFDANTGVMDYATWQKLKRHPLVVDRVSGGATTANPALVTLSSVAALFELQRLFVCKAIKATNVENETASYAPIHGTAMLVCYVPPTPAPTTPSAGYCFMWDVAGSDTPTGVYSIPDPHKGIGSVKLEIELAWDFKLTGADLGELIVTL